MNRLWSEVVRSGPSANENQSDDNAITLPIEQLTNTTGTYLQHLNEDCLLEIFSSHSLNLMDLCSLAETCARFKQIIQRVFPREFNIEHYEVYIGQPRRFEFISTINQREYALQDVERILKNFGSHLSTVEFEQDVTVMNLVEKYCGGATLKRLKMSNLRSTEGVRVNWNSIFERLLELCVYQCDLREDIASQDFKCDSLIELNIGWTDGWVAILKHTFPNLARFTFEDHFDRSTTERWNTTSDILFEFLGRHERLKTISLSDVLVSTSRLRVIDSSCHALEELKLKYSVDSPVVRSKISLNFSNLENLAKLKLLSVDFRSHGHSIKLSPAMMSLETVTLSYMKEVVQIFDVLSQQQNLRDLHLIYCDIDRIPWTMLVRLRKLCLKVDYRYNWADVINIIRRLTNLEILKCVLGGCDSLVFDYYLSREEFSEIVKIVAQRDHVLTLKCYCDFEFIENCDNIRKVNLINWNTDDDYADDDDDE